MKTHLIGMLTMNAMIAPGVQAPVLPSRDTLPTQENTKWFTFF
jgi:hypothetical protein